MGDLPELPKELKPIFRDDKKDPPTLPCPNKVPVPGMPAQKITFWDKAWIGTKHFIYGFLLSGVAAFAVSKDPYYLLVAGAFGGAIEAWRKVHKTNMEEKDSDWADVLDKLLCIVVELIRLWREKKSSKK